MSPSWTDRWFPGSVSAKVSVGIAVGRREICAVHIEPRRAGARRYTIHSAQLSCELFGGSPTLEAESALASALANVAAPAKQRFVPCHVALPDPMMMFSVFALDALPKSEKLRRELVHWRLAKEYSTGDAALDCAHQRLGEEQGKHLLLGQGVDKAWLQCIRQALRRAGVTPWSINMGASYRFNQFHDRFASDKHGAALIALDPDSWSVLIWDAAARPRLARARWRVIADEEAEAYDVIALEAERSILSYVRAGKDNPVARVYVTGSASELAGFTAALDRRLREGCLPLALNGADPVEGRKIEDHALAPLTLAAAVAS